MLVARGAEEVEDFGGILEGSKEKGILLSTMRVEVFGKSVGRGREVEVETAFEYDIVFEVLELKVRGVLEGIKGVRITGELFTMAMK